MASRTITYVWKIPRPRKDLLARGIMADAYQTAPETDPTVTTVLIRFVSVGNKEPNFEER